MAQVKEALKVIKTPILRGAYMWVWEPQMPKDDDGNIKEGEKPIFSVEGIFPWAELSEEARKFMPGTPYHELRQQYLLAIKNKWGDKLPTKVVEVDGVERTVSAIDSPFKIASRANFSKYDDRPEIHGKLVINFKSRGLDRAPQVARYMGKGNKPQLLDKKDPEQKRLIYPGAFYIVSTKAFVWEFMNKQGVGFNLNNIIKMKDGEPLAGNTTIDSDFGDMPEDYGIEVDNSDQFDSENYADDDLKL